MRTHLEIKQLQTKYPPGRSIGNSLALDLEKPVVVGNLQTAHYKIFQLLTDTKQLIALIKTTFLVQVVNDSGISHQLGSLLPRTLDSLSVHA
jgi:hypothetical protein